MLQEEDTLAIWESIKTSFKKFEWDVLLKVITATCFLLSLILSVYKAYNNEYLSSLTLLLVSFYSAFINDRITSNRK